MRVLTGHSTSPPLRAFAGNEHGNVAILIGLLIIPLLVAAGIAVDYGRAAHTRATVQEAADTALLRAARIRTQQPNISDADLTAKARQIFDATTSKLTNINITQFAVVFDPDAETFTLDMDGSLGTTIMRAAGVKSLSLDTVSAVTLGEPAALEVVMALDNTGSMNQKGKLGDLKSSASMLVEALLTADEAEAKVGLVPFAQYVNVGKAYETASWMKAPSSSSKSFMGCVGSRDYPSNLEDADYSIKPIPGVVGISCPDALLPMTNDKKAVLDAINGMDANGWTYIPAGLVWGWRLLSPEEPFTEGMSQSELNKIGGVKSLIVLTDGQNTKAPTYPKHDSANQSLANDLMIQLCDNIKADGIVIYSIAFDVSDSTIRSLMQDCATTPGHYFDPDSASELADTFSRIATSLRSITLSR